MNPYLKDYYDQIFREEGEPEFEDLTSAGRRALSQTTTFAFYCLQRSMRKAIESLEISYEVQRKG